MAELPADDVPLPPTFLPGPATGLGGTLVVGSKIGNRYTVIGMLGRGGMGAVYKAWDDELGVPVAIKTIAFSAGTDPGTRSDMERRFKREAQLAREITHRNVVRIHDIGDINGLKYLTMALVDGETLGARIRRTGPMPVNEVMPIARQIAEGLVAAHEVGIVHRDLKPANVMVSPEGHAYIMDFGIALSSATATRDGTFAGTIEYMSPEQSRGAGVDGRADIYAFGLILYDLLTGSQRLKGISEPMAELLTRVDHAPPPIRSARPEVPEPLDNLIQRMLDPKPEARYADAIQLQAALSELANDGHVKRDPIAAAMRSRSRVIVAAAVAVVALSAATVFLWSNREPAVAPAPPPPISVIVSNFENRTGDPIFDGLVEQALLVGIESASFINAFPRANAVRLALTYPDKTLTANTAKLIAFREGMGAVITGSIETAPLGYRLPVQVLKPGTEDAKLFDAVVEASNKEDVLNAVGRLAARVRSGLGDTSVVNADQVNINETFTANSLEAAHAYIEGQNLLAEGKPEEALAAYRKAVEIDPNLGRAYSGIGAVANNLRRRDEALEAYNKALSLLDRMTERERFRTRGSYYAAMGNAEKARDENEQLVEKFPSDAAGLSNLALAYFNMWNFAKALDLGRQSAAIYPGNVLRQSNVALYAMYASDFATAAKQAERVLELNKDYPRGHLVMALSNMAEGQFGQAEERYQALTQLPAPGKDFGIQGLVDVARYQGRLDRAASLLTEALAAEKTPASITRLTTTLASVRVSQGRGPEALKLIAPIKSEGLDAAALMSIGEVYAASGRPKEAGAIAATLLARVAPDARAFGSVLQARLALDSGNAEEARRLLTDARTASDAWLIRFWLGRAYLAMSMFPEADSEFDACLQRRGEAAAVLIDDFPTFHRWLDVYYYQGVTREGLKSAGAVDSFKTFLAPKEGGDETGGLVADARKRIAGR